jgi:polyhydroxyalkanoate synthesis regulator phasin
MEMKIGEGLKKVLLMGIGAAAVTAEKSQQLVDELVKRGELTVEQGKELNQELKRNVKKSIDEAAKASEEVAAEEKDLTLEQKIASMSAEELEKLKAFIAKAEESGKTGE